MTNTVTSQFVLVSVNPFKFTKSVSEKSHHFASEVTALSPPPSPVSLFLVQGYLGFPSVIQSELGDGKQTLELAADISNLSVCTFKFPHTFENKTYISFSKLFIIIYLYIF